MIARLFWLLVGNIGRRLVESSDRRLVDMHLTYEVRERYL